LLAMESMDYTMDDPQSNRSPNNASRCHYQQSQASANGSMSHTRESQHYDPVHDTNTWFHSHNSSMPSRPSYTAPQSMPQWEPTSFAPIHSWQGFGDIQAGIHNQGPDVSGYRSGLQSGGPMGMSNSPWNEMRAFEPIPFGYSAYTASSAHSNNLAQQNLGSDHSQGPIATPSYIPPPSFVPREPNVSQIQAQIAQARASQMRNRQNSQSESTQRSPGDVLPERASRNSGPAHFMEQRGIYSIRSSNQYWKVCETNTLG
jgi:hypothetical protein